MPPLRRYLDAGRRRANREDLLRSFDLLTKAESDIRNAAQPRYHLEMALLRWIHQRKLVAIEDLIQAAASGSPALPRPPAGRSVLIMRLRTPRQGVGLRVVIWELITNHYQVRLHFNRGSSQL